MTRSGAQIRQEFIDFFRAKQHDFVPSSPVVPYDDPTLLFTNAGMNQFKPIFLGAADPKSEFGRLKRAVNSQKCIRAGGKHNDLDDVGHDTYHHTFFEMLGNWSFGDYFKKEAIEWAWELLTDVWGLDKSRLHATYFEGDAKEGLEPDLEAKELWGSVTDIDPTHIHPGGKKDNFWEMGETGPCGPCSEIHIDLTPDKSGRELVNAGDARVMEIWNLVFIQFNRSADGKLTPLPAKHVDTGLGLERVTALIQGKTSNYDTDLFTPIFEAIRKVTGAPPYGGTLPDQSPERERERANEPRPSGRAASRAPQDPRGLKPAAPHADADSAARTADHDQIMVDVSYRVIADHIRCLTFALTDGAIPDRDGRGYVLRRILRRAVRYGWQYLNMHEPFLHKLVPAVIDTMGDAFPELRKKPQRVIELIRDEEESFDRTLDRGLRMFADASVAAFMRTFEQESKLSTTNGGSYKLLYTARRTVDATPVTLWEKGEYIRTEDSDGLTLIRDRDFESSVKPEREFWIDAFSPALYQELQMPAPCLEGQDAFKLHDTYGFPVDLTQIMAEEKGLRVDIGAYDLLMEDARDRARQSSEDLELLSEVLQIPKEHLAQTTVDQPKFEAVAIQSTFLFACGLRDDDIDVWIDRGLVGLVFDRTCFYAEQGGQVGDIGTISFETGQSLVVSDTKRAGNQVVHLVDPLPLRAQGALRMKSQATLRLDQPRREHIMQNHTATHILNWALRDVLCPPEEREQPHLQQRGSLVDPDKTRFDFSHNKGATPDELERIETLCNQRIADDLQVFTAEVDQKPAREINTLRAIFGEKYPDVVRVVSIGAEIGDAGDDNPNTLLGNPKNSDWMNYSVEFCGGTHVKWTGEIERFVLTTEEAVAKGIRRVVGITGEKAREAETHGRELLARADALLASDTSPERQRAGPDADETSDLATDVAQLQKDAAEAVIPLRDRAVLRDRIAKLQKLVKQQQKAAAADATDAVMDKVAELLRSPEKIGDTTVVVAEMPNLPVDQLKSGADAIKQKCGSAAVLFGVNAGEKALLLAAMSNDLIKKGLKAGDLVKHVAPIVKGGGGGPPSMAQAGGKDPAKLSEALKAGNAWIAEKLK